MASAGSGFLPAGTYQVGSPGEVPLFTISSKPSAEIMHVALELQLLALPGELPRVLAFQTQ